MTATTIRKQTKPVYTEMPARSWLLYGETKIGKTETAAAFPKPLILNPKVEDRTSETVGDIWDIPVGDVEQLKAAISYLRKSDYQFVVFDAFIAYIDDIIARQNEGNPLRKTRAANDLLFPILTDFFALPIGKVLTGHAKHETEDVMVNNRKEQRRIIFPDLAPSFRAFVTARVTAYGYCYAATGGSKVRWVQLEQPKLSIAAGNALGLPEVTDLRYDAILKAIVKTTPKPAADPVVKTNQQKWSEFVDAEKPTATTVFSALGVSTPSDWLRANPTKTIEDCMKVVHDFIAKVGPAKAGAEEKF